MPFGQGTEVIMPPADPPQILHLNPKPMSIKSEMMDTSVRVISLGSESIDNNSSASLNIVNIKQDEYEAPEEQEGCDIESMDGEGQLLDESAKSNQSLAPEEIDAGEQSDVVMEQSDTDTKDNEGEERSEKAGTKIGSPLLPGGTKPLLPGGAKRTVLSKGPVQGAVPPKIGTVVYSTNAAGQRVARKLVKVVKVPAAKHENGKTGTKSAFKKGFDKPEKSDLAKMSKEEINDAYFKSLYATTS